MLAAAFLLIACFLVVSTLRRPSTAVAAVLLIFPLEQLGQAAYPLFVRHSYLLNVAVALLALLAAGINWARGGRIASFARRPVIRPLVLLLLGYAFLSITWSREAVVALTLWSKAGPYLILVVGVAPFLLRSVADFRWMLIAFSVAGTGLVIAFVFLADWSYRAIVATDGLAVIVAPLALAEFAGLLFLTITLGESQRRPSWALVWRVSVALCCVALIFNTSSRGQLIAMLIIAALFAPGAYRVNSLRRFFVTAIVAVIFIGVSIELFETKVADESRWSAEGLSKARTDRLTQVDRLLTVWGREGPVAWMFGLGNSASYDSSILGFHPHNVPIEVLCEEGVVGLGLWLSIVLSSCVLYRRAMSMLRASTEERSLLAVLGAFGAFFALLSLKQGSLLSTYLLASPVLLEQYYRLLLNGRLVSSVSDGQRSVAVCRPALADSLAEDKLGAASRKR